jgi:hypothetical protein
MFKEKITIVAMVTIFLTLSYSSSHGQTFEEIESKCNNRWATNSKAEKCIEQQKRRLTLNSKEVLNTDIFKLCENQENTYKIMGNCIKRQINSVNYINRINSNDVVKKHCLKTTDSNPELIKSCIENYNKYKLYVVNSNKLDVVKKLCREEWKKTPKMIEKCVSYYHK